MLKEPTRRLRYETLKAEMVEIADRLYTELLTEFETAKRDDPARARSLQFGFAGPNNQLGEGDTWFPQSSIKFLAEPAKTIDKNLVLFPHLEGSEVALELGVGSGFLLRTLRDVFDMDAVGIDVPLKETYVYERIRDALGLRSLVDEHFISPKTPFPLRDGTDLIVGYLPMFHVHWTAEDHRWMWDYAREKMSGRKRLVFLFNRMGFVNNESVYSMYRQKAQFPLAESHGLSDLLCIIDL